MSVDEAIAVLREFHKTAGEGQMTVFRIKDGDTDVCRAYLTTDPAVMRFIEGIFSASGGSDEPWKDIRKP